MKIVKTLSEKSTIEIQRGGITNFASWERLKEYLAQAVGLKDHERILGITADEDGVQVRIGQKNNQ